MRESLLAIALCLAMAGTSLAQAQGRSLFGSSGSTGSMTGSTTGSTSATGRFTGGTQRLGRSLFGGGTQQTTGSTSQFGGSSAGQQTGGTGGLAGFDRGALTGEGSFVGGLQAEGTTQGRTSNLANQAGTGLLGQRNRRTTAGTFQNQRGFPSQGAFPGGSSGTTARTRSFRPSFRVGFVVPRRGTATALERLSAQLGNASVLGRAGIVVRQEGPAVVLEGEVPSDHERLLAETIARLEPGVSIVRNELTVAGSGGE